MLIKNRINKLWDNHTMENYIKMGIKKNLCATIRINLINNVEQNKPVIKNTYCMSSFM